MAKWPLRKKVNLEGWIKVQQLQSAAYNREFKQVTRAGAATAAVTKKVWGEYVSVVC